MLKKRMVHKDITDINIYTAKRIRDMAESLNGLAKTFGKLKGEPGLTREDGIAALEAASAMVCGECGSCGIRKGCRQVPEEES